MQGTVVPGVLGGHCLPDTGCAGRQAGSARAAHNIQPTSFAPQVIDGFNSKKLLDPPEQAKLHAEENKTELWQERTWQAILDSKAPAELIQPGARVSRGAVCRQRGLAHLLVWLLVAEAGWTAGFWVGQS